jgi:hypothetical protein
MVWGGVIMAIKDFIVKPIQDTRATYDLKTRQYIVTEDFITNECGWASFTSDVGGRENGEWYRNLLSFNVYEYVRSFKDAKFLNRLNYYLSHSVSAREDLLQVMRNVVAYNMQEGGMFMAYVTGINLQEAKNITNIAMKTVVGLVADQFIKNHGLAEREFRHEFDVVPSSAGREW